MKWFHSITMVVSAMIAGCATTPSICPSDGRAVVPGKRILVVINKWWECDPVMNVLLHDNARPGHLLNWPTDLHHPHRRPDPSHLPQELPSPIPRAVFTLRNSSVEIWCISDLLEHFPDKAAFQSSSEKKAAELPKAFRGQPVDFVIAVGTAGLPDGNTENGNTENGNVVVGTKIFMHNCHPNSPQSDSQWNAGPFDAIIESALTRADFAQVLKIDSDVVKHFIRPPLNPAAQERILADYDFVGLNAINVTDYSEYDQTDKATINAYGQANDLKCAKSLETTHGVIRVQSKAPFIFVSGIVDRVGHFKDDVTPRPYAQNTTGAHNAGIVVAWVLPRIDELLGGKP